MLNEIDAKILSLLQEDASLTVSEIGKRVFLSNTPCWQRIHKLKRKGYIDRTVAILNRTKLNVAVTVCVAVTMESHDQEKLMRFSDVVTQMPEVVECYRMSGAVDYFLKVLVSDIASYDAFYKRLINQVPFLKVTSSFVIEEMKNTHKLPMTEMD